MGSEITGKRLNILFVANEIFPDAHGGVHTYVYEIAERLVSLGHNVCVLTKKVEKSHPSVENINGIKIYRYENKECGFSFLNQILSILSINTELKKLVRAFRFDLISMHSPHAAFGVNLSKTAKKIPKVYTFYALLAEEEFYDVYGKKYSWYQWRRYIKPFWFSIYLQLARWLEKRGLKSAQKIISLSDFTSQRLIKEYKIAAAKIAQIPAGVDTERFKPASDKNAVRKVLDLSQYSQILFTVRRLVPRMGLDNLIKAMPLVLEKFPEVFLVIGGQGPLQQELKQLAEEFRLGAKIILTGFIEDEKLPLYYQACDLFILPSKANEGFGIVTLEALASGVPVLATPIGGSIEILNKLDKNLLFKDISPDSIASLIIEYLTNTKKRTEIENKCRQFILENYTWDKAAKQTDKLFLDIL
ncbi:MAG: glycosyltransferase family 4 protein [Candidatus Omnitrophota bacterium]|nr:glycosyltransferase family 4 protein [Candidatus Omnitrophota bacterium]